jgi:hypothetical protein
MMGLTVCEQLSLKRLLMTVFLEVFVVEIISLQILDGNS